MWLRLDLEGIITELCIRKYVKQEKQNGFASDYWCDVGFSFSFPPLINYTKSHDEILLSDEVDALAKALNDLLNDKLTERVTLEFCEPDFCFELMPKEDLRNNPRLLYIRPGHEIADICAEWKVFFWNGALTANYLTVTLDRADIMALRNYLFLVIGKYNTDTPEIAEMIKGGILYGNLY